MKRIYQYRSHLLESHTEEFYYERIEEEGVLDKTVIIEQMGAALKILQIKNPQKVLTLGGDGSVSVPVFSYLASQNPTEEIGIIWIDAHPDITLPGDPYKGFHAMALAACLGKTDRDIASLLPGKILPENVWGLGIRNYERPEVEKRFNEWSLTNIPVEGLKKSVNDIGEFIQSRKIKKFWST